MAELTQRQQRWRRLRRLSLWALTGLVLLAVLYPFWLARLIRPVAAHLGVEIQQCTPRGYDRLELVGLVWSNQTVTVRVGRLDLAAPHRWLLAAGRDASPGDEPQLQLSHWEVEIRPREQTPTPTQGSVPAVLGSLQQALPSGSHWLSHAQATDGVLRLGARPIPVPQITWRNGLVRMKAMEAEAEADLRELSTGKASLSIAHPQVNVELGLTATNDAWALAGHLLWLSNRFDLQGQFERDGLLPAVAVLESTNLMLNPEVLGLAGIGTLQGHARVLWTDGSYRFEAEAAGVSGDRDNWLPERIKVGLAGYGDLEAITLTRFAVESPLVNATLEEPLTVAYGGHLLGQNTRLQLQADLAQVESVNLRGALTGEVDLEPVVYAPLRAGFRLSGTALDGLGLRAQAFQVQGMMVWPLLQITNLTARLEPEGELSAQLEMKLDARQLLGLNWTFHGPWPGPMPSGCSLEHLSATGQVAGIWPKLHHAGQVDFASPKAAPFRADHLTLQWSGQETQLTNLHVQAISGEASIRVSANGSFVANTKGSRTQLHCSALDLESEAGHLQLQAPFALEWQRAASRSSLRLDPFKLEGSLGLIAGQADVHWPAEGTASLAVQRLQSRASQPFLQTSLPELTVHDFHLKGGWTNGPVTFHTEVAAEMATSPDERWSVQLHATADGQAVQINHAALEFNEVPLATLSGHWPFHFAPPHAPSFAAEEERGSLRVALALTDAQPTLAWVESRLGVRLTQPAAEIVLTNHQGRISAALSATAAGVELSPTNLLMGRVMPALNEVSVAASADAQAIVLEQLDARILQQPLTASARYDLGSVPWTDWWLRVRNPDAKRLSGQLSFERADLAALASLAPDILAPAGTVDLEFELAAPLHLRGTLEVTNGATRALKPLGAFRDVHGTVELVGGEVAVKRLEATLGGRPVALDGVMRWSAQGLQHMDLRVSGENLSLVHEPDLFVRADLDLRLHQEPEGTPWLTGKVGLQRSLLVRDFGSLVTLDRTVPERRPPWFNLTQQPLNGWQVDVQIHGDRFLNVLTPAFKGEVSASLQLLGTLGEPFLLGTVTVDNGKLLFPFGQLALEGGRVDFSRDDPYRPELDLRGEGLNFGYAITVEVTGPLEAPNVSLQSVPPLTAQQILLMLSAGEIPRSDFGYTTTDKASRIGLFVGKEFVNRFIGNTAATERLTLRSGEHITEEGRTSYLLEYDVTDRLSVFGEYNRFQDFNSGLKLKVLSK